MKGGAAGRVFRTAGLRGIPAGVWALGFVSMFMDVSSEMIHALLPVFMVSVLGASAVTVGVIEGVAEATASISKVFSGMISDAFGRRKLLVVLGYGMAAVTKPFFALAASIEWVFAARFADRIGKGIRGAPRDALVGELSPPHLRGASYGLRQALDTVGAFVGPLLAIVLMTATADDFRFVFWVAVIPAAASVAIVAFAVHEPAREGTAARPPLRLALFRLLPPRFWIAVGVATVVTMARFSEAFLVLRAQQLGLAVALVPLVLVIMNVAYALSAYPAGNLSDRLSRRSMLAVGMVFLLAADVILAAADSVWPVMAGLALWGLHMGFSQGILAALVADLSPPELRATAFGLFHLVTGAVLLAASVLAGVLWETIGPAATFVAGAGFALISLPALLLLPSGR